MPVYTDELVETNGYKTHYLDTHTGDEVVVLLHGGGPGADASTNWKNFIPGLADRYRVIAPDLFGFGTTDHPEQGPKFLTGWMRERVNQVIALLDALGIEKVRLIGNSAGGALSMWITEAHPSRVDSLVLMGSAGGQMAHPTPEVLRMATFYKDPSKDNLKALTKWMVWDETDLGDDLDAIVEARFAELQREDIRRSFTTFYSAVSLPTEMTLAPGSLRRFTQRVLLVHGLGDRFVPFESSVYLMQQIPDAQLHVLPNCGHWAQIEKRDQMVHLTRAFFDGEI